MNEDPYDLTNDAIPLDKRIKAFNRAIDDFGPKDPHILSFDIKVTPQVAIAFYELNIVSQKELDFLIRKSFDIGLVSVLMNIDPGNRARVYEKLDDFLKDKHPVTKIIEFLNGGAGSMTITTLYDSVERHFWGAVAAYLKDMDIVSGTISRNFRGMLYDISRWPAKKDQLLWLERAITHDNTEKLGVFDASALQSKYPKSVEAIRQFLNENRLRYAETGS